MSGRIALMVRGLPSIGIDEAVERFGKYYPEVRSDVWHKSPSFTGLSDYNSISFTDKFGSTLGGGGLDKQKMSDLRKMKKDFEAYTQSYPGVYTNSPNTESKRKLYRRIGFQDIYGEDAQIFDNRSIHPDDLPYTRAIDRAINQSADNNILPAFIRSGDNVVLGSKIGYQSFTDVLRGYKPPSLLDDEVQKILQFRKLLRQNPNESTSYIPPRATLSRPTIIDDWDDIPF